MPCVGYSRPMQLMSRLAGQRGGRLGISWLGRYLFAGISVTRPVWIRCSNSVFSSLDRVATARILTYVEGCRKGRWPDILITQHLLHQTSRMSP
jgi:hypothetical protein